LRRLGIRASLTMASKRQAEASGVEARA
jgi:hypothetical protein